MPNIFDPRFGSYKHTQKLKTLSETTNHKLEVPYYDKFYVTMKRGWEKGIHCRHVTPTGMEDLLVRCTDGRNIVCTLLV